MPVETSRVYMRRLSAKHRNLIIRRTQDDLNLPKSPRVHRQLTPEQRAELRKRFKDRKGVSDVEFTVAYNKVMDAARDVAKAVGKSEKSCLRTLMQLARVIQSGRKTSLWNAYVAICYEQRTEC